MAIAPQAVPPGEPKRKPPPSFQALSVGLLAATALLYATGFVVVFTYEHRLGLIVTGGDFFKVRYLHVGMLASAFVLLGTGPTYLFLKIREFSRQLPPPSSGTQPRRLKKRYITPIYLVVGAVYVQMTLASPGSFTWNAAAPFAIFILVWLVSVGLILRHKDSWPRLRAEVKLKLRFALPWLREGAIGGLWTRVKGVVRSLFHAEPWKSLFGELLGTASFAWRWIRKCARVRGRRFARSPLNMLVAVVTALGLWLFIGVCTDVPWDNWQEPWFWALKLALLAMLSIFLGRIAWKLHGTLSATSDAPTEPRQPWWFLGFPLLGFIYYLTINGFAFVIFPYIPVAKGGGDYTGAPLAVLYFDSTKAKDVPEELKQTAGPQSMIVLLETSDSFFVAFEGEDGDRKRWGKTPKLKPPRIFQVSRDSVVSVGFSSK